MVFRLEIVNAIVAGILTVVAAIVKEIGDDGSNKKYWYILEKVMVPSPLFFMRGDRIGKVWFKGVLISLSFKHDKVELPTV